MKDYLIEELYDRGLIPYDESIVLAEGFEDALIGVVQPINTEKKPPHPRQYNDSVFCRREPF